MRSPAGRYYIIADLLCDLDKQLFQQGLAVVVQVVVQLQDRFLVRDREDDDAVALTADIQRCEPAVDQEFAGFVQRSFHGDAKAEKLIAGRSARSRNDLICINLVEIAGLDHIGSC